MKDFMKYTLATIVGLLAFSIISGIITVVSMAGIMASESTASVVDDNSILRINLSGYIEERAESDPMSFLSGGNSESLALDEMVLSVQKAATNDKIKGIYLEGGSLAANSASAQEFRQALLDFRKSGKFIIAYGDIYTQQAYYICSAADTVLLNPEGILDWHGLSSQPIFYKEAMEKLGVKMQVFRVGSFKSAVEPFTNTEMSEANREQVTSYLTSIWGQMVADVAKSRKIKPETLNALADSLMTMRPAKAALEAKMVDRLVYLDEVKSMLRHKMGCEEDDKLTFASVRDVAKAQDVLDVKDKKVAVYYAYGNIVDDFQGYSPLNGSGPTFAPDKVNTDLQDLADNDEIAAVVIRINSGGGSAYASEQIWRQVELLKEKKPVVVSMGGVAASGGYYISSGAHKIFAEPTTLTGSIGIFGMVPDASELLTQKLGLHSDVVKTNAMSDFGGGLRALNAEECAMMQARVNRGYETFVGRVALGRKMKVDDVKAIAEGRVWTGEQAKKIGLVDELGNLNDAVKAAAKLAKCDEYNVARYPEAEPWWTSLLNKDAGSGYLESQLRATLGDYYTTFGLLRQLKSQNPIQASIMFDPNIK